MMMADEISVIEGGTSWCKKLERKTEKVKKKGMVSFGMPVLKHLADGCKQWLA